MPIYEYRCEKCGHISEFLIMGKNDTLHCKECGGATLTKILSAHNVTTISSSSPRTAEHAAGGCCGTPNSCGAPGTCCSK